MLADLQLLRRLDSLSQWNDLLQVSPAKHAKPELTLVLNFA